MNKKIELYKWIFAVLVICLVLAVIVLVVTKMEHRKESNLWMSDGIYIECDKVQNGAECILPDGSTLLIKKSWEINIE